jgi:hypothetical protein
VRAVLALVLPLLVLAAPAAHAETWSARDARGDAETLTFSPDPAPCGTSTVTTSPDTTRQDLSGIRVEHGSDDIEVRLRMRDLARRDHGTSWYVHLLTPHGAYVVDVLPAQRGEPAQPFLSEEPELPETTDPAVCGYTATSVGVPCRHLGVRLDPRSDQVELTVPRSCLGRPRWVRVGADVLGAFSGSAETGFTLTRDEWRPQGTTVSGYPPPYGPRVHAG